MPTDVLSNHDSKWSSAGSSLSAEALSLNPVHVSGGCSYYSSYDENTLTPCGRYKSCTVYRLQHALDIPPLITLVAERHLTLSSALPSNRDGPDIPTRTHCKLHLPITPGTSFCTIVEYRCLCLRTLDLSIEPFGRS